MKIRLFERRFRGEERSRFRFRFLRSQKGTALLRQSLQNVVRRITLKDRRTEWLSVVTSFHPELTPPASHENEEFKFTDPSKDSITAAHSIGGFRLFCYLEQNSRGRYSVERALMLEIRPGQPR